MTTKARVLVIDDEPIVRKSCDRVLRRAGFDVDWVADGQHGLDIIGSNGFDVVLLDLRMPGIDGVEVMRRIQQSGRQVKVIIFTAYPSLESMVETTKLGAFDYVLKPFTPDELVDAVKRVLKEREPLNEFTDRVFDYHEKRRVQEERHEKGMTIQVGTKLDLRLDRSLGQVRSIQTTSPSGKRITILGLDELFDPMARLPQDIIDSLKKTSAPVYTVYGSHEVNGKDIVVYLEESDRVIVLTRLKDGKGGESVRRLDKDRKFELPKIGYPQLVDLARKRGVGIDFIILGVRIDYDEKTRSTERELIEELKKIVLDV